jgi:SAM-dependent methyltransferase
MSENELPDYVLANRNAWDEWAPKWVAAGERNWASQTADWGMWGIPESELHMLDDVAGLDAIELGCGTGYVSAWLARAGARPVAIDNSTKQLETARRLQVEHGIEFPLIHGNAETVPLPDASFDFAISEYGAAIWADPYKWIPEAARLLRPGGRLVFLRSSNLTMLCSPELDADPVGDRLVRDLFGMNRIDWSDDPSVEFSLPHGAMFALLRASGFDIEDLIEIQAPANAVSPVPYLTAEWARRWPSEEVWKARKRG